MAFKSLNIKGQLIRGIALSSVILFSGCVQQPKPNYSGTDINATANSAVVQFESLKSATAILIKKTEIYDQALNEHRSLNQSMHEKDQSLSALNSSNDNLSTKISLLTSEIAALKQELEQMKQNAQKQALAEQKESPIVTPLVSTNPTATPSTHKSSEAKKTSTKEVTIKEKKKSQDKKKNPSTSIKADCISVNLSDSDLGSSKSNGSIPKGFTASSGKIIVRFPNTFVRTSPELLKTTASDNVKEGDVFSFIAKNDSWYYLKSGKYISKKSVVELTTGKK